MTARRRLLLTLTSAAAAAAGCKSLTRGDADAAPTRSADPLMGMRIPPQSGVPTKDPYADRTRDPLLTTPAGRGRRGDPDALPPRTANDPGREPYRPTLETTPAALAGFTPDADLTLIRGTPADTKAVAGGAADKLRALGATVDAPARTAGGYAVVVTVPLKGDPPGTRRYTGTGATPAAAAESALAQVTADQE